MKDVTSETTDVTGMTDVTGVTDVRETAISMSEGTETITLNVTEKTDGTVIMSSANVMAGKSTRPNGNTMSNEYFKSNGTTDGTNTTVVSRIGMKL